MAQTIDFTPESPGGIDFTPEIDFEPEKAEAAPVQGLRRSGLESIANTLKGLAVPMSSGPVLDPLAMATGVMMPETIAENKRRQALTPTQVRTEIQGNPIYQAGQTLEDVAPETFPLTPAQEASKWTKLGKSVGGFVPLVASGPAAPLTMGAQAVGEHIDSDFKRAKDSGLDDETAAQTALDKAMLSGAVQTGIFSALPPVLRAPLEKYVVNRFGKAALSRFVAGRAAAATEGATLGATSQAGENVVEGQPVAQDTGGAASGLAVMNLLLPWLREGAPAEPKPKTPEQSAALKLAQGEPQPAPASPVGAAPTLVQRALAEAQTQPAETPVVNAGDLLRAMQENQIKPKPAGEDLEEAMRQQQQETPSNEEPTTGSAPASAGQPTPPSEIPAVRPDALAEQPAPAQPGPAPEGAPGNEGNVSQEVEPQTYLIRHGSTDLNRESGGPDRIRGWIDVPLNDDGRAQARRLAEQLKDSGITTIVTSDLSRAQDTAKEIARVTGAQVVADPALRPWNVGELTGLKSEDVADKLRYYSEHPDQAVPGGESFNDFKTRFLDAYRRIQAEHAGETIGITTHFRGTRVIEAWRAAGRQGDRLDMDLFNQPRGMDAGGVQAIGKEPDLTAAPQPASVPVAAPETQTGGTAGPETSETPGPGTQAQTGAPAAMESGTIPAESSKLDRSAAAPRTGTGSFTNKRPADLIDHIEGEIGRIDPRLIREADPNWKPIGAARKIFKSGGTPADVAADALDRAGLYRGDPGQPDQLGRLVNEAAQARKGMRQRAAREDQELRQASAFQRDVGRPGPDQRVIIADDLQPGDTIRIRGAPMKVREFEFDDDGRVTSVTLDDGAKYGTRTVEGGTELQIDKRSLRRSDEPVVSSHLGEDRNRTRLAREGEQGQPRGALEAWADKVIEEGKKRLNVGLDPELLAAYTVKGALQLARIARQIKVSFDEWAIQMLNEFGQAIAPHLRTIWPEALKLRAQQIDEQLKAAGPPEEQRQLTREAADVKGELEKVSPATPKAQPAAAQASAAAPQSRDAISDRQRVEQLTAQRDAVTRRLDEINKQASRPGGLTDELKSERYQLAKSSRQIQRELNKNPEHVADLLRKMDQLGQQMDNARKAGNGLSLKTAGDELMGLMGDLEQIDPKLRNQIYNDLVARREIMGSNLPPMPEGRSLATSTAWLRAQGIDSPRVPILQRFQIARRVADEFSRGKDLLSRLGERVTAAWQAFVEQYRHPTIDDDFRSVKKEWGLQRQWTGLETYQYLDAMREKVADPVRRMAMTAWLEAGGDANTLRAQADMVPAQYKPIFETALKLTDGEKAIAHRQSLEFEQKLEDGQSLGLIDKPRADYGAPHLWRVAPKSEGEYDPFNKSKTPRRIGARLDPRDPFFSLARTEPTYFDGIMNGGVPKSMELDKLVGVYNDEFHGALADRAFIKDLKDAKDKEGNPIVMISGAARVEPREGGKRTYFVDSNWRPKEAITNDGRPYEKVDHWALRDWKFASRTEDGNPVIVHGDFLVHPDYAAELRNDLGDSLSKNKTGAGKYLRWALNTASFLKASKFASATFHGVTIAEHALGHGVLPITRGVNLDPATNPKLAGLMRHGLELGFSGQQDVFQEGLGSHGGIWAHVPGLGDALKAQGEWLFKEFIPKVKAKVGLAVLDRNLQRYGKELSEAQIYELTAQQMNAGFGMQNWRLLGTDKTMLDVSRLLFTAPDFLLSRSKVIAQALKPYNREQRYFLLAQAGLVYVAARALNMLFDNDPHTEQENALSVVHNGRAYSGRFLVSDVWNMIQDFRSHQPGWNFLSGRLGPGPRIGYESISGRDLRTGARVDVPFQTDSKVWRGVQRLLKDVAEWMVPVGMEGLMPGAAGKEQTGPGQIALGLIGVGSHKFTAQTQVYDWAKDFNRNSTDPAVRRLQADLDSEARAESAYRKLDALLDAGDQVHAGVELQSLVDEGHKLGSIVQHYDRVQTPFTGSNAREGAFRASLDQAQRAIYDRAIQERVARLNAFAALLRQRAPALAGVSP